MTIPVAASELTPACALGFIERLTDLMNRAGLHKSGFISFLVESTDLSRSGARRILTDKRPPKRKEVFLRLARSLATLISARIGHEVMVDEVVDYLIEEKPIHFLSRQDSYDISEYLKIDPVLTSQIIIRIQEISKASSINTAKDLHSSQMNLIHFRIISYCFKNHVDHQSQKVANMIESLFELAMQDLL